MKNSLFFSILLSSIIVSGQKFHTVFEYANLPNKGITIKNSYPKCGMKYKSQNDKKYIFAVFWTYITNNTDPDLEVKINFSANSFILPSSPNINFNLYLPMEEMKLKNEPLLNYGLNLKSYLDENIDKPSELIRNIPAKESLLFYIVTISKDEVNGTIKAGFELENKNLIYKINS